MLENYTLTQWIAFFFIYSFLGWCIESTIVSVTRRKLVNRGFLRGPMLPLYGSGAVIMLVSTLWAKDNFVLVYVCGLLSATLLEYVTGAAMEAMFNMRYWDYSSKKFNIKGYICLKSSLFWGFLAVVLVCVVHTPIAAFVESIDHKWLVVIVTVVFLVAAIDTYFAFKQAFDFQKVLAYETAIKEQLADITERFNEAKDAFTELSNEKQTEFFSKQEENIERLRTELGAAKEKALKFRHSMMHSFPSATSAKFGEALDEFKDYLYKKK